MQVLCLTITDPQCCWHGSAYLTRTPAQWRKHSSRSEPMRQCNWNSTECRRSATPLKKGIARQSPFQRQPRCCRVGRAVQPALSAVLGFPAAYHNGSHHTEAGQKHGIAFRFGDGRDRHIVENWAAVFLDICACELQCGRTRRCNEA